MLARNSIHAMQGELETLVAGRAQYAHDQFAGDVPILVYARAAAAIPRPHLDPQPLGLLSWGCERPDPWVA